MCGAPSAGDDGADYRPAIDRLQPIAGEFGVTPGTLFAHLVALAESLGPVAGVVDAENVRRRLRRRGLRERSAGAFPTTDSFPSSVKIDVDAVVRGPIEGLNPHDEVANAEALLPPVTPPRSTHSAQSPNVRGSGGSQPTQRSCFASGPTPSSPWPVAAMSCHRRGRRVVLLG
jgi:hypothetical protein